MISATAIAILISLPVLRPPKPIFEYSCKLYSESGKLATEVKGNVAPVKPNDMSDKSYKFVAKYSNDNFDDFEGKSTISDLSDPDLHYAVAKSVSYTNFNDDSRKIYTFRFRGWRSGQGYFVIEDVVKKQERINQLNSVGICRLQVLR